MKPVRRARAADKANAGIGAFRARHLKLTDAPAALTETGPGARFDAAESPLLWLARRKLIAPHQLLAGERLRGQFTLGQMMPRTTANWQAPVAGRNRAGGAADPTERALAARQATRQALDAVGPELSGLLLDVCCFLKRLEDVERERGWPARSAKVVLQLALERLARHYGYAAELRGAPQRQVRAWSADKV